MSAVPQPFITPEEYLEREHNALEKHEYVVGQVFAKAGASLAHSAICVNLVVNLLPPAKRKSCRVLESNMRVRIPSQDLYTYPDVTIVCGKPELIEGKTDTLLNPVAIFEVLSPSTEGWDRGGKFAYYRSIPTLQEYFLVAQDQPRIERYVRERDHWILTTHDGLDAEVQLACTNERFSLRGVYENIEFPSSTRRMEPIED